MRYFITNLITTVAAWFSWLIANNCQVKTTLSSHETKPLLAVRFFVFSFLLKSQIY